MIAVECNADEALVRALGITRKEIRHEGNKGKVCAFVRKVANAHGLIDEDPGSTPPKYLRSLIPTENKDDLRLLEPPAGRRIIVICPRLEDWILRSANLARVSMEDFGLPDDAASLHNELNRHQSRLSQFVKLVEELLRESERMKTLERLLKRE